MFEDENMQGMPEMFSFDPTIFATNFSSNFRSFRDEDILNRIIEMSAR